MCSSCGYANECFKLFASNSSCFSVLSLDIFWMLSFKVIHMIDMGRTYKFEINGGNSWRRLETTLTLTCHSSLMKPPVYLDGSLLFTGWERTVVAFNLKTKQALLIPVKFPLELSSKTLFAAGDNSITLISATEKVVYFYALTNILSDRRPKWVLLKQIHNGVMDKKKLYYWNVLTYNGKCLVLSVCSRDYNQYRSWDLQGPVRN